MNKNIKAKLKQLDNLNKVKVLSKNNNNNNI